MIGIFGSAFNPPTLGHKDAIDQALERCDQVWLVPSIHHPFGKDMLPFSTRWRLVQSFVSDLGDHRVRACDVEKSIWDGLAPVYTIAVMSELQRQHPGETFAFLCGPDVAASLDRFAFSDQLKKGWEIIVLEERTSIRSTLVRNSRQLGLDIEAYLTPTVKAEIHEESLYE